MLQPVDDLRSGAVQGVAELAPVLDGDRRLAGVVSDEPVGVFREQPRPGSDEKRRQPEPRFESALMDAVRERGHAVRESLV